MKGRLFQIVLCGLCVAVGILIRYAFGEKGADDDAQSELRSRRLVDGKPERVAHASRVSRRISNAEARRLTPVASKQEQQDELARLLADLKDGETLSEAEREIIVQLQELLGDITLDPRVARQEISRLLAKIAAMKGRVSIALKRAALRCASVVDCGSAIDILPFLTDESVEIRESALEQFMQAVSDFTLGDRDRAQLVVAAAMTMTSGDQLDWVFSEFGNMRHSVAAEAFVQILENGTDVAKDKVVDSVRFYTGEEGIETVEELEEWLRRNPDGEFDADFYDPPKADSRIGIPPPAEG